MIFTAVHINKNIRVRRNVKAGLSVLCIKKAKENTLLKPCFWRNTVHNVRLSSGACSFHNAKYS
jgi:hypothetical protein